MPAKLTRIIKRLLFGVYNPRYYPAILNKHYLAVRNKKLQLDDNLIEKARDFYTNNLIDFSPIGTFEKTLRIMPRRCIDLDPHEFWSTSDMFDKEQAFFLHRFYWVNENYDANKHYIFNDLVDFWVANLKNQSIAQTPYNTSERIVNCINFICKNPSAPRGFINKLHRITKNDISALIHKIEFPYTGVFNNHIINNARAIMWSAMLFCRLDLGRLAQELACYAHKTLFDENGCLNEASFHYQLIVTQRLKEVSIIGKEFFEFDHTELDIEQTVTKSQQLLSFLERRLVRKVPLIGDVSPDVSTNLNSFKGLLTRKTAILGDCGILSLGSWFILHNSRFLIFLNAHQLRPSAYPNDHGHDDFLSFVLFYEGNPVFVDPGNLSYEDRIYRNYQNSEAHNTIKCSQVNTEIVNRTIHSRIGRLHSICLSQFYSCGRVLKRYIHLNNESVFLTDILIRGKPNSMLFCQFQLGSEFLVYEQEEECVLVGVGEKKENLSITGYSDIDVSASVSSDSYGLMKQSKKLICYPSDTIRNTSRARISCC